LLRGGHTGATCVRPMAEQSRSDVAWLGGQRPNRRRSARAAGRPGKGQRGPGWLRGEVGKKRLPGRVLLGHAQGRRQGLRPSCGRRLLLLRLREGLHFEDAGRGVISCTTEGRARRTYCTGGGPRRRPMARSGTPRHSPHRAPARPAAIPRARTGCSALGLAELQDHRARHLVLRLVIECAGDAEHAGRLGGAAITAEREGKAHEQVAGSGGVRRREREEEPGQAGAVGAEEGPTDPVVNVDMLWGDAPPVAHREGAGMPSAEPTSVPRASGPRASPPTGE